MWVQRELALPALPRGVHLVTDRVVEALPELRRIRAGLLHVFVRHTSASLALNESASPEVRRDLEAWLDATVAEGWEGWTHTLEGDDDMPAHVKSVLTGPSLTIPVSEGRPALGTWQGVYLCEHRDRGGPRRLTLTAWGE
jgi:secondary thiamine-phosphate synthase enzyme